MVTYPTDWTEYSFNNFLKIKRGASPRPIEYYVTESASGVNWIKIGDAPKYGKYIMATKEKITESGAAQSVRVYPGDFLLSNSMSFGRPYILGLEGCIHDGWLRLFEFQNTADDDYLYYLLSSDSVQSQYQSYAAGSGVQNLNKEVVKKVVVCLPGLSEQQVIAETLSCIDTHIANLTELIEKKKAIRDGALEDLVSGRTRLDGFSDEWNTMPLSKFTAVNPRTDIPDSFVYVDLESVKGISLVGQRRENKHSAPSRARRLAQKGDVFYQTVRPYQKNNYLFNLDGDYVFSTGYAQLRTNNDPNYLFLLIRQDSFVNCVLDNCTGTSYPAINPKKLSEIEVYVPIDIEEQRAIAQIIMVMDTEIATLEEEKDKMLQIKAGAMDDLLTGRVRLMRQGG
ncbi:MAG: restriction endonuclease subunit S [Clostridiaceae bacterium]|nr:restriction endonuclease subunit S [Clostridiaceae bacterium]